MLSTAEIIYILYYKFYSVADPRQECRGPLGGRGPQFKNRCSTLQPWIPMSSFKFEIKILL